MNEENNKAEEPHTMPCCMEAERRVLGAVLQGNLSLSALCEVHGVSHKTFYDTRNRIIFETMRKMSLELNSLDLPMLHDWLYSCDQVELAGGEFYIRSLLASPTSPEDAECCINIIRKKQVLRRTILVLKSAILKCHNENPQLDLLLGELEQELLAIPSSLRATESVWKDSIDSASDRIGVRMDSEDGSLSTGIPELDSILKGLHGGQLVVLTGRTSADALALKIVEYLALGRGAQGTPLAVDHARPHPVAVLSMDLSAETLAYRMICSVAGVCPDNAADSSSSRKEMGERIHKANEDLKDAPIYVCDERGLDVISLRAHARRMMKKYQPELVVVYGCQLLEYRSKATFSISRELKAMAEELNRPVIAVS